MDASQLNWLSASDAQRAIRDGAITSEQLVQACLARIREVEADVQAWTYLDESHALNQAREFNKAVPLTGLIVTKLDGTSKGGMVVAIQKELGLPIKFVGLGEQADDLQPFDAKQFAQALFEE